MLVNGLPALKLEAAAAARMRQQPLGDGDGFAILDRLHAEHRLMVAIQRVRLLAAEGECAEARHLTALLGAIADADGDDAAQMAATVVVTAYKAELLNQHAPGYRAELLIQQAGADGYQHALADDYQRAPANDY